MILEKIEDDPQSGACLNISYADVQGLVANFNPTGSPFAQNGSAFSGQQPQQNNAGTSNDQGSVMETNSAVSR